MECVEVTIVLCDEMVAGRCSLEAQGGATGFPCADEKTKWKRLTHWSWSLVLLTSFRIGEEKEE